MSTAISPWADSATKESPDGCWVACFEGGMEICQGGPLRGTLKIRRKESDDWLYLLADASASFVWASDSTALAVPRWTEKRAHQLIVIRVPTMSLVEMGKRYRVLQLDSFDGGLIAGIDSPVHQPESFTATLTSAGELIPSGGSKKPWWKFR